MHINFILTPGCNYIRYTNPKLILTTVQKTIFLRIMSNNNYKGKISTFVIPPSNPWSCRFLPKATHSNDSYAGTVFQTCKLRWFWEKDGWNSQHKGACLYPFPDFFESVVNHVSPQITKETEHVFDPSISVYLKESKELCWQEHNNLWRTS